MTSNDQTVGYELIPPKITIEGVSLLESLPVQCALHFSTIVFWRGHRFDTEVKRDGATIDLYVTLEVPPPRPMRGMPLEGTVNLGALEPGEYDINVHFRKKGFGAEGDAFRRDASVSLLAQGREPPVITPEQSSGWAAWVNAMPGPGARPTLHVVGTLKGVEGRRVSLIRATPQGFNPNILLLRLVAAADAEAPAEQLVRYSEGADIGRFSAVTILFPNGGAQHISEITIAY